MLINKALLSNGYSIFRLEILEYCDKERLIDREQYYLDLLKPEYNILDFAYSSLGFKHSASTLKKMKDRIITPEHKFKLKKHLNELNSKQFTDEFKSKLSKGMANFNRLSKSKKVYLTNIKINIKFKIIF
jgi:group I intron endonuclease